jgi:hypothetical protein
LTAEAWVQCATTLDVLREDLVMGKKLANPDKVAEFLRSRKPSAFCDQCIADLLKLGNRSFGPNKDHYNPHIAQQNANAFSRREFPRTVGRCHKCSQSHKLVTRSA